jgi:hypothetical protein
VRESWVQEASEMMTGLELLEERRGGILRSCTCISALVPHSGSLRHNAVKGLGGFIRSNLLMSAGCQHAVCIWRHCAAAPA